MPVFKNEVSPADLINSLIAGIAIVTLYLQYRFNKKSLEFPYQPRFSFSEFPATKIPNVWMATDAIWTPRKCQRIIGVHHDCKKDHWFDISNVSEFPAVDCQVLLVHNKEFPTRITFKKFDNRVTIFPMIAANDKVQFSLHDQAIDTVHFDGDNTDYFYLILRYKTINDSNYFLQVYTLSYIPFAPAPINFWTHSIRIYGISSLGFKKLNRSFPERSLNSYLQKLKWLHENSEK